MDTLIQDVRATFRSLLQNPGFAGAVILIMAIGIGVTTAIFSVVYVALLSPLPYANPDRLTFIWKDSSANYTKGPLSLREIAELTRVAPLYENIAGIWTVSGTLLDEGPPTPVRAGRVTSNFFATLGVAPASGRWFTPDDEIEGTSSAIISAGLWHSQFGGADVIGHVLKIEGGWGMQSGQYRIVGIMPAGFELLLPDPSVPRTLDLWVPFQGDWRTASGSAMRTVGRLVPGATIEAAQSQIDRAHRFPGTRRLYAVPLHTELVKDARPALLALQAAVGFVLLTACTSIATLLLIRAQSRRKEMGVRVALGATRGRLARLLLTESLVLAAMGGALGIALAAVGVRVLPLLDSGSLPRVNDATLSGPVLLFSAAASVASGLLFGLAPLASVWRGTLDAILRAASAANSGAARQRTRSLLVLAEIGLSVVLLIGAGLLIRTFFNLHTFSPGYRTEHVLTFRLSLPGERYGNGNAAAQFAQQLERQLHAIPGVQAAGVINEIPLDDEPNYATVFRTRATQVDDPPLADSRLVTPGYFETIQASLVAGRWFTQDDDASHPLVVMVDDRLARRAWPGGNAVGQDLRLDSASGPWARVVGVVRHLRHHRLSEEVREEIFLPFAQRWRTQMGVVVRAVGEPASVAGAIKASLAQLDPNLTPARLRPLEELAAHSRAPARFSMILATLFAAFSLFLACSSLYGVIAYSVSQRMSELGVRAALGATGSDLTKMVTRQGLALVAVGLALGFVGAAIVMGSLKSLLFGVTAFDALTFAAVPLLVGLTALLACYVPARHAARVDPMHALRRE